MRVCVCVCVLSHKVHVSCIFQCLQSVRPSAPPIRICYKEQHILLLREPLLYLSQEVLIRYRGDHSGVLCCW